MQKSNYKIEKELGQGGFATTWLARDKRNKQACVLKKIQLAQLDDWKSLELFERECKTLKHLDHPGIPNFLDAWSSQEPAEAVLVQEYVTGKNLQQLLADGRRFKEPEVIALALQLCDILSYLHSFSPPVIHRDIKPSNLILDQNQRLYLIDFGAVRQTLAASSSQSMTVIGTFGYMPLEQMEGKSLPASDLYAMGATLVFLLTGRPPAEMEKKNLKPDFRAHSQLSVKLCKILDRLLEPDLNKRYKQVTEVIQDLHKLQAKQKPQASLFKQIPQLLKNRPSKRTIKWALGIALFLIVFVITGLLSQRPHTRIVEKDEPALFNQTENQQGLTWQPAPLAPWQRLESAPQIKTLSEAPDGTVWGLANNELYAFKAGEPVRKWNSQALINDYASLEYLEVAIPEAVWFSTTNGKHVFRFSQNQTQEIDKPSNDHLVALGHWQKKLLAAFDKKLYLFNTKTELFDLLKEFPEKITALHSNTQNELWVGSKNYLYSYSAPQWKLLWKGKSSYDDEILIIHDTPKYIYLGLEKSAWELDRKRNTSAPLLVNAKVTGLAIQPGSAFWLATTDIYSEGLYLRAPGSSELQSLGWREGMPGDRFNALLLDSQNQLWLSANYSGQGELWRAPIQAVKKAINQPKSKPLPSQNFENACEAWSKLKPTAQRNLAGDTQTGKTRVFWHQQLVCPYGEGFRRPDGTLLLQDYKDLYTWQKGKLRHQDLPRGMLTSNSLLLDSHNQTWIARAWPNHIIRSKASGGWESQTAEQGLSEEKAALLYQTQSGQILAGVRIKNQLPLQIWDSQKKKWQNSGLPGPDLYVEAQELLELRSGELALATDKGLFIVSKDLKQARRVEGLPYPDIHGLAEDAQGQLWIIYNRFGKGRGLSVADLKKGTIRHLDSRQGLVPDRFQEVAIDSQDRIWLMEAAARVQVYALKDLRKVLKIPALP
jgi:hypothetical protein